MSTRSSASTAGDPTDPTYALHHTSVHTVQAEADTISLLVRGPSAKQRFLILDANTGSFFWVYRAAQESPEQRTSKRSTPDQLSNTIARLQRLIIDIESGDSIRTKHIVNWLLTTKSNTLVLTETQPSEGGRHILACLQAEGFAT
jgi:hypothetical protein